MKRALILVALVVAVIAFGWASHSLADPPQDNRYSGPDFGKDPPPKKITEFLRDLFA